jgi:hypothetical protein
MSIFDFKKRFGESIEIEEMKKDFVNKISHFLFQEIDRHIDNCPPDYPSSSPKLFNFLCLSLNINPSEVLNEHNRNPFADQIYIPPLKSFIRDNFETTLLIVEILYEYFQKSEEYGKEEWLKKINEIVILALNQPIFLGITWKNGKFYPEEAKELEEKLISDILTWLDQYPKIKLIFKNAMDHYSQSLQNPIKRRDVISNSFQAVEEITRVILKNDKSFDNNFNELVEKLNLNAYWKKILNYYKELSKEFGRHPGRDEEFIPEQSDAEAFLYLSGLLIRLTVEKLKNLK